MNEEKRLEIKNLTISLWEDYTEKSELAKHIESGYIFGEYADNEHYKIDDIVGIIAEVELEKNPIVEEQIN